MMSYWLRRALAAEAVILAVALWLLVRYCALDAMTATAGAVGMLLAVHSFAAIGGFAISRRHSVTVPPEPGRRRASLLRVVIGEWLAFQAVFVLIQPFERLWMGDDATGGERRANVPILLIHGYLCNRGAWWWIRHRLRASGFAVATVNLEPPLGSIDDFADQLHARIESLRAETGAEQVALVGHSMGGLAARAYLRRHGLGRVAKLVTLASPHHGTWLARHAPGRNARQIEPDSAWIRALPPAGPGLPTLTVWSPTDNFVAPQDSSRLTGASEKILPGLGHLSMLFSPVVLEVLTRALA
jgi:triacylglycerol lipase